MSKNPATVPAHISLEELVRDCIYTHHFHMFPVMRDSTVLGCISTKEVKNIPREEWDRHSVQELLIFLNCLLMFLLFRIAMHYRFRDIRRRSIGFSFIPL